MKHLDALSVVSCRTVPQLSFICQRPAELQRTVFTTQLFLSFLLSFHPSFSPFFLFSFFHSLIPSAFVPSSLPTFLPSFLPYLLPVTFPSFLCTHPSFLSFHSLLLYIFPSSLFFLLSFLPYLFIFFFLNVFSSSSFSHCQPFLVFPHVYSFKYIKLYINLSMLTLFFYFLCNFFWNYFSSGFKCFLMLIDATIRGINISVKQVSSKLIFVCLIR